MDIRRISDSVIAGMALVVGAPLMLAAAIAVRSTMGSPVFYKEQRYGYNGKLFTIYKFRTMTDLAGPDGRLLPAELRKTFIGRLMRSTALDELPQLFNILIGDMTFIGPRPYGVEKDLPGYTERYRVKPGLTGLAQVNEKMGVTTTLEQAVADDLVLVHRRTLALDLKILFQTAAAVTTARIDTQLPRRQDPAIETFRESLHT